MDGGEIHFAPPKKPGLMIRFPCKYHANKGCNQVVRSGLHPHGGVFCLKGNPQQVGGWLPLVSLFYLKKDKPPEPCKELRRRIPATNSGWDYPLLTFIYPGFHCGSNEAQWCSMMESMRKCARHVRPGPEQILPCWKPVGVLA